MIRNRCSNVQRLRATSRFDRLIPRPPQNTHRLSYSACMKDYQSTLQNLRIGAHTRVMFQGFTGKQATANASESLRWGTNIVGGTTPGREGDHLGLPVLPSVRKAVEVLKPDATGIYVAAHQAPAAIEEAIEAEVPLVVAVAEHIPLHDILRIHSMLKTQSASRLVGANSPGIISATDKCRIGFQPLSCFIPGKVGIVARSGTLSYETAASTTRSGLGQSLCIGVGGDIIVGTDMVDGLEILKHDPDTHAIALVGEIGGAMELEAAAWIKAYNQENQNPKPIVALIAGTHSAPGRVMGHAGAFTMLGEPSPQEKVKALKEAGAVMVNHPSRFGGVLKSLLDTKFQHIGNTQTPRGSTNQARGMHTLPRRKSAYISRLPTVQLSRCQKLHLSRDASWNILREYGLKTVESSRPSMKPEVLLAIGIDRESRSPCVMAAPTTALDRLEKFPYNYTDQSEKLPVTSIAQYLQLPGEQESSLRDVLSRLIKVFREKEAFSLRVMLTSRSNQLVITDAEVGFDDAAWKSAGRQKRLHALRDTGTEDSDELAAEKYGIVYIKLPGNGNIGTLVNGAGLAMNTVDALADAGGKAANFLDTGGKATSETVKKSFEVILKDPRVNVIFVNIFGGLTLGDMIARGVILAFRDLNMKVPVVVRIRGTNEREGQRIITESNLPLHAYDDFDEAAAKAIELAGRA